MFYSNATARPAALEIFLGLADGFRAAYAKRKIFNQTVRELSALSDRELSDLGIARVNIAEIAREAAYGA